MKGEIQVLNVGDGDAILVYLTKPGADLVMVIDGGLEGSYQATVKPALDRLLARTGKTAPDLVVATHFDNDHIGGLIPLMEDYADGIQKLWVHRTPALSARAKLLVEAKHASAFTKSFAQHELENTLLSKYKDLPAQALLDHSWLLLETLSKLEDLLNLVSADKIQEVFHNDSFPGWPELRVLGPTPAYYAQLFPAKHPLELLLREEFTPLLTEDKQKIMARHDALVAFNANPCDLLKTEGQTQLTPTNRASIILALDGPRGRYLFTGDAGIASFKSIPNWRTELADLFWLKVPHHGSDNNMTTGLVNVMRPVHADNSGDHHEDPYVLGCIARNARSVAVRTTKNEGNLVTLL